MQSISLTFNLVDIIPVCFWIFPPFVNSGTLIFQNIESKVENIRLCLWSGSDSFSSFCSTTDTRSKGENIIL